MGEMTIRLDDAIRLRLESRARLLGLPPEVVATQLVQDALGDDPHRSRADVAREIRALQTTVSPWNSVDLIREDRDR